MIAGSCTASAIASANPVIGAPLALPARTRYNTSGLERPLLWPVLRCRPMAGFEVSTEAAVTRIVWAPQAIEDVEAIRAYVAHDSPHYANLVVERIVTAVSLLESSPRSGRVVPEVGDVIAPRARPWQLPHRVSVEA